MASHIFLVKGIGIASIRILANRLAKVGTGMTVPISIISHYSVVLFVFLSKRLHFLLEYFGLLSFFILAEL